MPHKSKDPKVLEANRLKYKCPKCGQDCKNALGLASHVRHKHPDVAGINPIDRKRMQILDKIQAKSKDLIDARRAIRDHKPVPFALPGIGTRGTGVEALRAREASIEKDLEGLLAELEGIKT